MGGLIGVAVGAGIATLISVVSVGTMTLKPVISMDSILLAMRRAAAARRVPRTEPERPGSNALLEALACGLPAVFRRSGGHPELVGDGGVAFDEPEEVRRSARPLVRELDERRSAIRIPSLAEVADRYLEVLRG